MISWDHWDKLYFFYSMPAFFFESDLDADLELDLELDLDADFDADFDADLDADFFAVAALDLDEGLPVPEFLAGRG